MHKVRVYIWSVIKRKDRGELHRVLIRNIIHGACIDFVAEKVNFIFIAELHECDDGVSRVTFPQRIVRIAKHQSASLDSSLLCFEQSFLIS